MPFRNPFVQVYHQVSTKNICLYLNGELIDENRQETNVNRRQEKNL